MDNVKLPIINKVAVVGSLVNEPMSNTSNSGNSVVNFKLACKRRFKHKGEKREETCFVNITAWSKLAESCTQFLHKRAFVYVEGQLQSRNWVTKGGDNVSTVGILAKKIQFLTKLDMNDDEDVVEADSEETMDSEG